MKRIVTMLVVLLPLMAYSQDKLPEGQLTLDNGVYVHRSGTRYSHSGTTYTELYEVVTDSLVHRFGMEFRSSDSTFVRRVPMEGCTREFYDSMQGTTEDAVSRQEEMRKETEEFINSYGASYDVWRYFRVLKLLNK